MYAVAHNSAGYSWEQTGTCRANNQWQLTWDEYSVHGWLLSQLPCSLGVTETPVSLPATSGNVKDTHDNKQRRSWCIFMCKHPIMAVGGRYRSGAHLASSPTHPRFSSGPARPFLHVMCLSSHISCVLHTCCQDAHTEKKNVEKRNSAGSSLQSVCLSSVSSGLVNKHSWTDHAPNHSYLLQSVLCLPYHRLSKITGKLLTSNH